MNVLMTGALGYIGRLITPHLGSMGIFCTPFDKKDGKDIFNEEQLVNAMKGLDGVIHLAGLRGPECELEGFSKEDFKKINLGGSKAVFDAAHKAGIKRFAFSSSIEVYGFPSLTVPDVKQCDLPVNDDTPIAENNHVYADMKIETEKYFKNMAKKYGITAVALRFGGINATSPWGIREQSLARAFHLALTTNNVDGFDYAPICDLDKKGIDLSRAGRVLGYF